MSILSENPVPERMPRPSLAFSLLSNGEYAALLTSRGTGAAWWRGLALFPWQADLVEDREGLALYLRDRADGSVMAWGPPDRSGSWFAEASDPGLFTLRRQWNSLEVRLEAWVDPRSPLELRRILVRNLSRVTRRIEITSLAEIALQPPADYASHPVFSKLFLQTERDPETGALLVRRRPRGSDERHPCVFHCVLGTHIEGWETDRARFVGRGRSLEHPLAMDPGRALSRTLGNVLDPALSLRGTLTVPPGEEREAALVLGFAERAEEAADAIGRLSREGAVVESRQGALTQAADRIRLAGLSVEEARAAEDYAGRMLYNDPSLGRAGAAVMPFLVKAQRYWRSLGLECDAEPLGRIEPGTEGFVDEDTSEAGAPGSAGFEAGAPDGRAESLFFNGLGGFSEDGREYLLHLRRESNGCWDLPPRPWINVIANQRFGFLVSETGAGCTWGANSRQYRLTPWYNDPLLDPYGEALYLRDEETGRFWSPLPGPAPGATVMEVRHGFGYTLFRGGAGGLETETTLFAAAGAPVKIVSLRISNPGPARRRLSVYSYARLVLGDLPQGEGRFVETEADPGRGMILARNPQASAGNGRTAFSSAFCDQEGARSFTCDRRAFVGSGGRMESPAALVQGGALDGRSGRGFDPCAAWQVTFDLPPGRSRRCCFLLGDAEDAGEAADLAERYGSPEGAEAALEEVRDLWSARIGRIQVRTPSLALDLMVNGWLVYQTLSCRLWARTALYQSGGAFGYRDQLQDAGSLIQVDPDLTRRQILLHAAHQFSEGDVLHWWHPLLEQGLRTRFADDLLWLPYAAAQYIESTGDGDLLNERAPFVTARLLEPEEDEVYLPYTAEGEEGDLYEHCVRALDRSLSVGAHGLPLFGSGDWNDGMNRVGRDGKGESVWMAFFLYEVLGRFLPLCRARSDEDRARPYEEFRRHLEQAVNRDAWDGDWYLRGFFGDGTPLGSHRSSECRIDALAQSWAVLSGLAPPDRARQAMDSLERHLVSEKDRLIRLLTPAFRDMPHDPGYIKGYLAGIRENGGQYTHAALWVVKAMAVLDRRDRAFHLLDLLNPVNHARNQEEIAVYQVEPYVVAADVYGEPPHVGRGGWTWYTGSSGWMYRVALESILGLTMENGDTLAVRPCIPEDWPGFSVLWTLPGAESIYRIEVENGGVSAAADSLIGPVVAASLDGSPLPVSRGAARIPLDRSGLRHQVKIVLGPART